MNACMSAVVLCVNSGLTIYPDSGHVISEKTIPAILPCQLIYCHDDNSTSCNKSELEPNHNQLLLELFLVQIKQAFLLLRS